MMNESSTVVDWAALRRGDSTTTVGGSPTMKKCNTLAVMRSRGGAGALGGHRYHQAPRLLRQPLPCERVALNCARVRSPCVINRIAR